MVQRPVGREANDGRQSDHRHDQAAYDYQIRINKENMDKILKERPNMQVVVLTEGVNASRSLSQKLHTTYYDVVANAYPSGEQSEA